MKKLLKALQSLVLGIIICMQATTALAAANEVIAQCPGISDTYIDSKEGGMTDFDDNQINLAGSVYDRAVLLSFDISSAAQEDFHGAILKLTVRCNDSASHLKVNSYDPQAENIRDSFEVITTMNLTSEGRITAELVVSKYIEKLVAEKKTTAYFAVTTDANVMSVFSMENRDKDLRPSLLLTSNVAYVSGQKDFDYPQVTKARLAADLSKTVSDGHPYLFGRKADFDRVRALCFGEDENLTSWYNTIKEKATTYIGAPPEEITGDLSRTSYISRGSYAKELVLNCAFVYLMEGDTKYAQRAYEEAKYFADMPTWGTLQYIDNNQLASSVAFCYDWLYDYLTQEQKDILKTALREKHLDTVLDLFRNSGNPKYNQTFYLFYFAQSNHTVLDNTSTFMEALAIADDDKAYSAEIMAGALENLQIPLDAMCPDGAWQEGVGYWSFVGPYLARMFSAMHSAFGTWYGWENISSVVKTSDFPLYAQSSLNPVMYCDSGAVRDECPEKFYFGKMLDSVSLQTFTMETMAVDSPLVCLWYNPETNYNEEITLSKDKLFRNLDMAIMRGPFDGKQEMYCALTCDSTISGHRYTNKGTITVDALGTMWITIPGRDDYGLPGYNDSVSQNGKRWKYYFSRAEANNCVVINPSKSPGQGTSCKAGIDTFVTAEREAFAITDLTAAYEGEATSYKRGLMLADDRTRFILQDEIDMAKPSEVYSFINFKASDFEITEDGDVIVTKDDRKMYVNIICDSPYDVSVMNCTGLPSSDLLPGERLIRDMKKIAIHFGSVKDVDLRVEMIPYLTDEELVKCKNDIITPLSDWKAADGDLSYPVLDDLKLDGVTPENFSPYDRCYFLNSEGEYPEKIEASANSELYDVKVTNDTANKKCIVVVTDKNDSQKVNSYCISIDPSVRKSPVVDESKFTAMGIKRVYASTDDGNVAENTLDGDLSTRWSAEGEQFITYELDGKANIAYVALACYLGNTRQTYFDVEVSDDGRTWKTVGSYESSGATTDFEYFDTKGVSASYVRLHGYGNSTGQWNSIADTKILKAK